MDERPRLLFELQSKFGQETLIPQATCDEVLTLWAPENRVKEILRYLKDEVDRPFQTLYDLTAIDERERINRQGQPEGDFTLVYHLLSSPMDAMKMCALSWP